MIWTTTELVMSSTQVTAKYLCYTAPSLLIRRIEEEGTIALCRKQLLLRA